MLHRLHPNYEINIQGCPNLRQIAVVIEPRNEQFETQKVDQMETRKRWRVEFGLPSTQAPICLLSTTAKPFPSPIPIQRNSFAVLKLILHLSQLQLPVSTHPIHSCCCSHSNGQNVCIPATAAAGANSIDSHYIEK